MPNKKLSMVFAMVVAIGQEALAALAARAAVALASVAAARRPAVAEQNDQYDEHACGNAAP